MRSQLAGPLGAQVPRIEVAPPRVSSAGAEAVELAASAGLDLDPWQQHVLEVGCGEAADGRWAALEVGVCVPRQNGKGSIIEARELAGLLLFGERLILHSAHEFKTAIEAFRRVRQLIDASDDLRREVAKVRTSHGEEAIVMRSGAELRFVARTKAGSGRGFTADLVVLDEAMILPSETVGALLPTLSARPNPQVWLFGSAGLTSSKHWWTMRRRALDNVGGRMAWLEWSAADGALVDDPATWATANPALGRRIQADFVQTELAAMPRPEFVRERLGWWDAEPEEQVAPAIDSGAWQRCADVVGPEDGRPMAVGIDVSPDRCTSVVVAGWAGDYRVLEVLRIDQGIGWVASWLAGVLERNGIGSVVVDPSGPSVALVDDLRAAGVPLVLTAGRDNAAACGQLVEAVASGSLRVRPDQRLDIAALSARRRQIGESWTWSRSSSSVDVSPLVAGTLALWGLGHAAQRPVEFFAF